LNVDLNEGCTPDKLKTEIFMQTQAELEDVRRSLFLSIKNQDSTTKLLVEFPNPRALSLKLGEMVTTSMTNHATVISRKATELFAAGAFTNQEFHPYGIDLLNREFFRLA
jgi:hypothetical protein